MKLCAALAGLALIVGPGLLAFARAAPAAGQSLFDRRCGGCHALDRDKEGPRLGGVYGRTAGSIDSFDYSSALKKSGIQWNEGTLEKWLADPDKLAPGNGMDFHLEDASERQAIIAYLKQLPAR